MADRSERAERHSARSSRANSYPSGRMPRLLRIESMPAPTSIIAMPNRPREARMSIQTLDVPTILRNNIHNVIEELRPIVERARNSEALAAGNMSFSNWLGTNAQPANSNQPASSQSPRDESAPAITSNDVNITMEDVAPSTSAVALPNVQTSPTLVRSPPIGQSPTHSSSSDSNNDEIDPAEIEDVMGSANSIVINSLAKYIPFLFLLLSKFVFDHISGILLFLLLFSMFYYFNVVVKREAARQTGRNCRIFSSIFAHIFMAAITVVYVVIRDVDLHICLGIMPLMEVPPTLADLLWSLIVTDFTLKLITVAAKLAFISVPYNFIPTCKRGKWLLAMETTSQLYRSCIPIQPWLHYLLESYRGPKKIIGVFLSAAYMVSKGQQLMMAVSLWWGAFLKILRNATIGVPPTKEQLALAGAQCPICHDEYKTPVLLECQHIFCESCVCKWLDREQTCPLCRAKIVDDPSFRDGSTSYFIQVF